MAGGSILLQMVTERILMTTLKYGFPYNCFDKCAHWNLSGKTYSSNKGWYSYQITIFQKSLNSDTMFGLI